MGLGIASLAAFLITLVTGVLLMFYYKPYPTAAYDSIKDIHFVVPTGRFTRNIHRWAANVMVVTVILHMARTILAAIYALYSIWLVKRYNSTRAGALGLFTCFLCGFLVLTIVGTHFRGPNWAFYWSPADWPAH